MPIPFAAIAGGLGAAGKWLGDKAVEHGGSLLAYKGVKDTNRARLLEASQNRDFQERMSNTSWQRGVKDMEAAGLNPALGYGQGGASSPGGSMASGLESPEAAGISTALAVKLQQGQLNEINERTRGLKAQNAALYDKRTGPLPGGRMGIQHGMPSHYDTMLRLEREMNAAQVEGARHTLPQLAATAKAWSSIGGNPAAIMRMILQSGGGSVIGNLTRMRR